MKFLIQRVKESSVKIDGEVVGSSGPGYMILFGACNEDNEEIADKMIAKLVNLRIFADSEGKTNLSIMDVGGQMLIISQFTLYANCKKGNRPSFFHSGDPAHAKKLYDYVTGKIQNDYNIHVETGEFGADMEVSLVNDGPFTIMLDSNEIL